MTVKGVKLPYIQNLEIPIPPITEQKKIVIKLDALCVEVKKLEANYRQKLADLKELRQSFLHKAFAGELLPRKNVDFLV
jgi:restriction endonuclease S subunit